MTSDVSGYVSWLAQLNSQCWGVFLDFLHKFYILSLPLVVWRQFNRVNTSGNTHTYIIPISHMKLFFLNLDMRQMFLISNCSQIQACTVQCKWICFKSLYKVADGESLNGLALH